MKCQFTKQPGLECNYCKAKPPKASKTLEFMKNHQGKFMQPIPSVIHPQHFTTFLEMIQLEKYSEGKADELGKCKICPDWSFSTVTEQDRNRKLLHPKQKAREIIPIEARAHKCTFKIDGKVCGEILSPIICSGSTKQQEKSF